MIERDPERERQLAVAAKSGDQAARDRLVETCLPAIAGVARLYSGFPAVERSELIQEGVVGLLRAAERYEPRRGTPFWAYAAWWVRQAMQQCVAERTGPVVLSDRAARQLARVRKARREYQQARGEDPSPADLAAATGLTRKQVEDLLTAERLPRSLDAPVAGEEDTAAMLEDMLADPRAEDEYERVMERLRFQSLPDLTDALDERERDVLYAHYGLGSTTQSLREIASGLGVSIERVRQIEERALGKLRDAATWPQTDEEP